MPHDVAADGLIGAVHLRTVIAVQRYLVFVRLCKQGAEFGKVLRCVEILPHLRLREGHGHMERVAECQCLPGGQPIRAARQRAEEAQGGQGCLPRRVAICGRYAMIPRADQGHRLSRGEQDSIKFGRQARALGGVQSARAGDADAQGQGGVGGGYRGDHDGSEHRGGRLGRRPGTWQEH